MGQVKLSSQGQTHGWFNFVTCGNPGCKPGKDRARMRSCPPIFSLVRISYVSTEALYCHSVSFPSIARHLMKYLRHVMSLLCWCFHSLCAVLVIIRINILISNMFQSSLMGFYSTGSHQFLPISFILILTTLIFLLFVFQLVINSFQKFII